MDNYHRHPGRHSLVVFGLIIAVIIFFSAEVISEVRKQKRVGIQTNFWQVLKGDIKGKQKALDETINELPGLTQDALKANFSIRQKSLDNIAQALDIYNMDTGKYPTKLEELIPNYIKQLPDPKSFPLTYELTRAGYELSTELPNGEIITRTQ
ncbi:MAG: hypothetical protein AAB657_04930 [Patescibacteria group bacterium]